MIRKLVITIDCGEETCASEPGKFCKFLGTTHFGTQHVCCLFPQANGSNTPLKESVLNKGWIGRCHDCHECQTAAMLFLSIPLNRKGPINGHDD